MFLLKIEYNICLYSNRLNICTLNVIKNKIDTQGFIKHGRHADMFRFEYNITFPEYVKYKDDVCCKLKELYEELEFEHYRPAIYIPHTYKGYFIMI